MRKWRLEALAAVATSTVQAPSIVAELFTDVIDAARERYEP